MREKEKPLTVSREVLADQENKGRSSDSKG